MSILNQTKWFAGCVGVLLVCSGMAYATDIGGPISSTVTIMEDSQLVDDVTCTVTGAPCIAFGAPNLTLELNGFTMTGQADPQLACNAGGANGNEPGIAVVGQNGVTIHGPGLVEAFRGFGIALQNAMGSRVTHVSLSTNCFSGIIVIGGSQNELTNNISVRNGSPTAPCGGI